MGGLVARAMLEDPEFDSGNVTKLIMVAPPNQGSLLARVGYGTDLLDHAVAEVNREEISTILRRDRGRPVRSHGGFAARFRLPP